MKRILISFVILLSGVVSLSAQKVAFVNTELILGEIPEYLQAQEELNSLSDTYKAAIETELDKIETLYNNYQARKATMTASQRSAAEEEIISKEKVVKEKQNIYFGQDGIMAKKSEELLIPIQKKVNNAIEKVAKKMDYSMVLDLAVTQGVVYYKESDDITDLVVSTMNSR